MGLIEGKMVPKDWGYEWWIVNNDLYCGKILCIKKGSCCSLHYHKIKDEVLYVQDGKMVMITTALDGGDKKVYTMMPGNAWRMLPNTPHQMYAVETTYIIEFSTHHEDSDSYRLSRELQITEEELCETLRSKTSGSEGIG